MRPFTAPLMVAAALLLNAFVTVATGDVTQHYTFHASSANEVRDAIDRFGPIGEDGQHHDAQTKSLTHWQFKSASTPEGCTLASVTVTVDITFIFPDWADLSAAPTALAQRWRSYMLALTRHENGHKKIALEAADTIRALVGKVPVQPNCPEISRLVSDSAREILARAHARNLQYDKDTDHGRTQGARFP